jgi:NAD(P)-dependent dehydrogenase (short-subunit alcohol dehydrogenase family)
VAASAIGAAIAERLGTHGYQIATRDMKPAQTGFSYDAVLADIREHSAQPQFWSMPLAPKSLSGSSI